jgi:hypothetical protein
MPRRWNFTKPECIYEIVCDEKFNQLLDEWSEFVYLYLSQPTASQSEETQNLKASCPKGSETKRTGTDD